MTTTPDRAALEAALSLLTNRLAAPLVVQPSPSDLEAIQQAVDRVRAHWTGGPEASLTIALAGGTGAGKSTLTNALAGARIAEASELRPTTMQIRVYHHRDLPQGNLPVEIGREAQFVAHDRPELRAKVIVDTPDLDSLAQTNRRLARSLLRAAGLVLYVFSPERYADERVWSVIREEKAFSTTAAVLNRIDSGVTPADLERIKADLVQKFAEAGLANIRIFTTAARRHVPGENGAAYPCERFDETAALKEFIEAELQTSDIMRMIRNQRASVAKHLANEVERIVPAKWLEELAQIELVATQTAALTSRKLHELLRASLDGLDTELGAVAVIRQHERFRGPFRTWLVIADFVRYGLAGIVDRLVGRSRAAEVQIVDAITRHAAGPELTDMLRDAAAAIGDAFYARGLPLEPFRKLVHETHGDRLLRRIAAELEKRFDERIAGDRSRRGYVIWFGNTLGGLVPAAFVIGGLYVMGRDLFAGQYVGLPLLGHLAAMVILFFLALQAIVSIFLPGARGLGQGVGTKAIQDAVQSALVGWIAAYRERLLSDRAALEAPVKLLEQQTDAG